MLHTGWARRPSHKWAGERLKTNREGRKGEPALFDKNNVSKLFSLSHTQEEILEHLEKQSTHPTDFSLFLDKNFKILINNSDGKQDAGARANGPEEVSQHWQGADAQATKRCRRGDVPARQNKSVSAGQRALGRHRHATPAGGHLRGWCACPTCCWHTDGDFMTQGRMWPGFLETSQ